MKPALSAEEWAKANGRGILDMAMDSGDVAWEIVNDFPHSCAGNSRHALAALCLHGQPFGFTREDVRALWCIATNEDGPIDTWLESLIARIEALLPPE